MKKYMQSDIDHYYRIAPEIVNKINNLNEDGKKEYYDYIYNVITKCCELIKKNENESAYNEYKLMVEYLSRV